MASMTMARTVALVYLGPYERWEGKNVDVVKDSVVQTPASIYVTGSVNARYMTLTYKMFEEALHVVTRTIGRRR